MQDVDRICGVTVDQTNKKLLGADGTTIIKNYNSDYMTPFPYTSSYKINYETNQKEGPINFTIADNYYGYAGNTAGLNTASNTKLYDILFKDTDNGKYYWLASRGVRADSHDAFFGPGYVGIGDAISGSYGLFNSGGFEYRGCYAVCPIITLKSDVTTDTINKKEGTITEEDWSAY